MARGRGRGRARRGARGQRRVVALVETKGWGEGMREREGASSVPSLGRGEEEWARVRSHYDREVGEDEGEGEGASTASSASSSRQGEDSEEGARVRSRCREVGDDEGGGEGMLSASSRRRRPMLRKGG